MNNWKSFSEKKKRKKEINPKYALLRIKKMNGKKGQEGRRGKIIPNYQIP